MVYDNNQIEKNLKDELKKFPLYKEEHFLLVHTDKSVYIGYAPTSSRSESTGKSKFDIEIKGDVCYINCFSIEKKERKNGYGSLLYRIIEDFCVEQFNCKTFVITPSGLSKENSFWEKRGFKYMNAIVLNKVLT